MKKLLPILVVLMLFVAGGTTYYAYSLYSSENDKDIEPVEADNENEEVEIKEQILEEPIKESVSTVAENNISTSITINLDDKIQVSPETHDVYSEEISLPLTIINHTVKDIKGFLTNTVYKDMFGDIIYELELKYEYDVIPANDSIQWIGAFDVNHFNENDMRFYTVPYENIKFEYEIKSIYFTDGTSIEI